MATERSPIKIRITNQGEDSETPWADDLGPAPTGTGQLVRLINVPFMHAKPTWGDVLVVEPGESEDDFLTWDRGGIPFEEVGTRIHEDGGRWAMIVDYQPSPASTDLAAAFTALTRACAEHDIVCEGAWGPREGRPGRAYLAVLEPLSDVDVMERLGKAALPLELIQIHPEPAPAKTKKRATKAKKPATKTKKPAAKTKKPATKAKGPATKPKKSVAKAKKPAKRKLAKPVKRRR